MCIFTMVTIYLDIQIAKVLIINILGNYCIVAPSTTVETTWVLFTYAKYVPEMTIMTSY